jgi:hypothetical protein
VNIVWIALSILKLRKLIRTVSSFPQDLMQVSFYRHYVCEIFTDSTVKISLIIHR